jgi:hypothetical protein
MHRTRRQAVPFFARNRFGHDAPCTGALWQVPARRLETAGRGAQHAAGFGIPVKIVAGRQSIMVMNMDRVA